MIIVATGISGTDEKNYLKDVVRYAKKRGKKIKVFQSGDMFFEQAQRLGIRANRDNIFHMDRNTSCALRGGAFEKVLSEAPSLLEQGFSIIVNMHASFFSDDQYSDTIDYHYLSSLNPDLYINFLNNADAVTRNLQQRRQFRHLFRGRDDQYALERIMEWQTAEILATRIISSFSRKKFFVVPARGKASILFRLMFESWRKMFYVGMPMTFLHGDEHKNAREEINNIVNWVDYYVNAIDPRYVEPLEPGQLTSAHEYRAIHNHVVGRDCNILIPQCDGMIGCYPQEEKEERVHSYGENYEESEMYRITGDTFRIFPSDKFLSPFFTKWVDEMFLSIEDFKRRFLEYLDEIDSTYLVRVEEAERGYTENNG
jgi:adenylate kinase